LWNHKPVEGDKFVTAEIDWLVTTRGNAVQFSLSGNSPVAISQIAALSVDNTRCGSDVKFIFPDSGFVLAVPSNAELIAPVFTNALMFYTTCIGAIAGDTTTFQVLNSVPPAVPIAPTRAQANASVSGVPLTNGNSQIIPTTAYGTITALSINVTIQQGASAGNAAVTLVDGTSKVVWSTQLATIASTSTTIPYNLTGLNVRFSQGLQLAISGSTITGGIVVNVYYTIP
jgi:hypothetical protein